LILIAASAILACTAGCSSTPSRADRIRSHATELQSQVDLKNRLAGDWEKGAKAVAAGERLVKRGEGKVKRAEKIMADRQS
jgi:outer membrane murein-binding lipoprotein Lpp